MYPKISYLRIFKEEEAGPYGRTGNRLNSLKRVSIVQQVEQVIADRIVDGTYAVDTKLPAEMTLSKQLGVGRGTVREAFRLLEAKRGL